MSDDPVIVPEDVLRTLGPQVLGVVARRYGDFAAAEDAVQEALIAATTQWPRDGVPDHPQAWLVQVAGRRLVDQIRSDSARRQREVTATTREAGDPEAVSHDDTLTLLFLCCHPALTPASAIALTLRAVGGLTTAEVAGAFLIPEATMAQRISRSKQRIRSAGTSFTMPSPAEFDLRLASVLHVLYLMFNEGYSSTSGDQVHRADLSSEAIRLTRLLYASTSTHPEVSGLLALMLLTDARRPARTGPGGRLVPLAAQDRSRWDAALVGEGLALVDDVLARHSVGPYQVQAAIAALHDEAPSVATTDWEQIAALYTVLERLIPGPMITLNRAVAVAEARGPEAGLRLLDTLSTELGTHHRWLSTRAHLLAALGEVEAAIDHFERAIARTTNLPEREYLTLRLSALRHPA